MIREFTHAGGIVFRQKNSGVLYLVITAKGKPEHWVLPKGHVKPGESFEEAATREVREETGTEAKVLELVGDIRFLDQDQMAKAVFFLMEYIRETDNAEDRIKRWCTYEEALELLTFEDSRDILRKARGLTIKHQK